MQQLELITQYPLKRCCPRIFKGLQSVFTQVLCLAQGLAPGDAPEAQSRERASGGQGPPFPAIPARRILLLSPRSRKATMLSAVSQGFQALRSLQHLTCRLNLLARTVSSPGLFHQRDTQDTPGAAGPGPQTCSAPGASDANHHPSKRKEGQKTPDTPPNHCSFLNPLLFILFRM